MERIAMSQEERDGLDWLKRAKDGSISQREAAQKMGVSDRWVRTLLKRMKQTGRCGGRAWIAGTAVES
jgi:DNA-binding Lrp family transcriptional regulator